MEISWEAVETDLAFSTTIIPLSQYYTESERRKVNAKARIEEAWGVNWEDKLGEMLPPWPAEEFLRELARFAERNRAWDAAKTLMENNIAERLAARRTKKYKWLTSRDIAEKTVVEKKRLQGRKANNNEESLAGQEAPTSKSLSPNQAMNQAAISRGYPQIWKLSRSRKALSDQTQQLRNPCQLNWWMARI